MTGNGSAWPQLNSWHLAQSAVIAAAVGAVLLLLFWRRLLLREKALLVSALALIVLLLCSDVQTLSMTSYRSHMIEHLIVILVIAPLVAAGINLSISRPFATIGFLSFTVLIPLYHLTALGSWVMSQSGGHFVELGSFLVVGIWFWTPVYGARRVMNNQQRLTYMLLALPVVATTGLVLWSSTSRSLHTTGMSMSTLNIGDIHNGGLIMMVWGSAMMIAHTAGLALFVVSREHASRVPIGLRYS